MKVGLFAASRLNVDCESLVVDLWFISRSLASSANSRRVFPPTFPLANAFLHDNLQTQQNGGSSRRQWHYRARSSAEETIPIQQIRGSKGFRSRQGYRLLQPREGLLPRAIGRGGPQTPKEDCEIGAQEILHKCGNKGTYVARQQEEEGFVTKRSA